MVHEALYQFLNADTPYTREEANTCFPKRMEEAEIILGGIYWFATRVFGRLIWRGNRKVRQWRGEGIPVESFYTGSTAAPLSLCGTF